MRIIAEREHYLLVSDGKRFTVVELSNRSQLLTCNEGRRGLDPMPQDSVNSVLSVTRGGHQMNDCRGWIETFAAVPSKCKPFSLWAELGAGAAVCH